MSVFDLDLDHTDPLWGHTLANRFLTAAQACGFECGRVFVADGITPEAPPPNPQCQCQLAATVATGIAGSSEACYPVLTAEVTLWVDLCVLVAGQNAILTPAEQTDHAAQNQRSLWRIMQGLMDARVQGTIAGLGARLTPGPWEQVSQTGGSARWQTRWLYRQ